VRWSSVTPKKAKQMNSLLLKTIMATAMVSLAGGGARAEEVTAKVSFQGTLRNAVTKQSLRGNFNGRGEYGRFDLDVDLSGSVLSQPDTRLPERVLYGKYPVEIDLRVGKSGISASDSFKTNIEVRRRSIMVNNVGTIRLARPINPTRSGAQRIRGKGTLRYDF